MGWMLSKKDQKLSQKDLVLPRRVRAGSHNAAGRGAGPRQVGQLSHVYNQAFDSLLHSLSNTTMVSVK